MNDRIQSSAIKKTGASFMSEIDSYENKQQKAIDHVNICLEDMRKFIEANRMSEHLKEQLFGLRLGDLLCLVSRENKEPPHGSIKGLPFVDAYEIPIDGNTAKKLEPNEIVEKYGSANFEKIICAAIDIKTQHYARINREFAKWEQRQKDKAKV